MILNETCKSYTLVPHGFRTNFRSSIFRASEQNSGIWPLDRILAATSRPEIFGPNFAKQFYRASKITWRLCDINVLHNCSTKTKAASNRGKSRRTMLLSTKQTIIHASGRWMESQNPATSTWTQQVAEGLPCQRCTP